MINKTIITLLSAVAFLTATAIPAYSENNNGNNATADSLATKTISTDSIQGKKNFFRKIADYFSKSNKYDPSKKMDFGIIGGPHYNSTTGLGLGIVASGLYSLDKTDSILPLSNLSLFGDVTTSGFLMIGVKGNNVFPQKKYRLDYNIYVYTFPTKYWGIGVFTNTILR